MAYAEEEQRLMTDDSGEKQIKCTKVLLDGSLSGSTLMTTTLSFTVVIHGI